MRGRGARERNMNQQGFENFGGYRKARELFELAAADMETLESARCVGDWLGNRSRAPTRLRRTSKRVGAEDRGKSMFNFCFMPEVRRVKRAVSMNECADGCEASTLIVARA